MHWHRGKNECERNGAMLYNYRRACCERRCRRFIRIPCHSKSLVGVPTKNLFPLPGGFSHSSLSPSIGFTYTRSGTELGFNTSSNGLSLNPILIVLTPGPLHRASRIAQPRPSYPIWRTPGGIASYRSRLDSPLGGMITSGSVIVASSPGCNVMPQSAL